MKKRTHFLIILAIFGVVLLSGCITDIIKNNSTANETENIKVQNVTFQPIETVLPTSTIEMTPINAVNINEASESIFIEGKAMKDGADYYVAIVLINQGDKPVKMDFMEEAFFMGSFENRFGYLSLNFSKKKILMPGESSYYSFTTGGNLDSLKVNVEKYKNSNVGFYLRMSKKIGADENDAYITDLPPLESLPSKSDNLRDGYTVKFRRTIQNFGTEVDSLYAEAVLFAPPNNSIGTPKTKDDYDYLVMVKLVNKGKDNIVFDKVTTLIDDGGSGIWGNTPPMKDKYWVLKPGEPLHLVFSTTGYTRQAIMSAKRNQKTELYFSFELSYQGKSMYKVFITPLSYMENLPDSEQILSIDGIPLKLLTFDNPKKST